MASRKGALVEHKRDVVTCRFGPRRRRFNTVVPSSGKVMTGGVDAKALQRPKRSSVRRATWSRRHTSWPA